MDCILGVRSLVNKVMTPPVCKDDESFMVRLHDAVIVLVGAGEKTNRLWVATV